MHRNAEIWQRRHEMLEQMEQSARHGFEQAARSPHWGEKGKAVRAMWYDKWGRVERRVWNALCVAKGWRKA